MFRKQNYQEDELVELSPSSVLWFLKGQLVFSLSLQSNSSWIGVNVKCISNWSNYLRLQQKRRHNKYFLHSWCPIHYNIDTHGTSHFLQPFLFDIRLTFLSWDKLKFVLG
jgi:hypothetical protein